MLASCLEKRRDWSENESSKKRPWRDQNLESYQNQEQAGKEPESIRLFRKQKLAFQTLKGISKWYQPLEMQLIHETVDGTCRTMTFFVNTPSHRQFNAVLSSEPDLDRLYPPSLFYTKMKTGTVPRSSDWWSSHPQKSQWSVDLGVHTKPHRLHPSGLLVAHHLPNDHFSPMELLAFKVADGGSESLTVEKSAVLWQKFAVQKLVRFFSTLPSCLPRSKHDYWLL